MSDNTGVSTSNIFLRDVTSPEREGVIPHQGPRHQGYEGPGGSHEAVAQCGDHERRTRGQGGRASCGGHTSYSPRHGAQPRPHLHTGQRAGRGGVEGGAGGEQQDQQDQGGQGGRHHSDCQHQTDTETLSVTLSSGHSSLSDHTPTPGTDCHLLLCSHRLRSDQTRDIRYQHSTLDRSVIIIIQQRNVPYQDRRESSEARSEFQ